MSKPSTSGLTASGPNEGLRPIPTPTEEERQKLLKSAERLVGRHGWRAFAEALAQACQLGAKTWEASSPQASALWQHRAETLHHLAEGELQATERGSE